MPINVKELKAVLRQIEEDPSTWCQSMWASKAPVDAGRRWGCGTKLCFAGHVVVRAGYKPVFTKDMRVVRVADDLFATSLCRKPHCKSEEIRDVAQRILGIDAWWASLLFNGGNDLGDLRAIVNGLVELAENRAKAEV